MALNISTTNFETVPPAVVLDENRDESEENFKILIEKLPLYIAIFQDGYLKYVNPKGVEISGWTLEELTFPTFNMIETLVVERFRNTVRENIKKRLKGETVPPYEISIKIRNGEEIPVLVLSQVITYCGRPATAIILWNIKDIRVLEERLRSVFSVSPMAITLFDLNRHILDCNEAFLKLHGYSSANEAKGKDILEFFSKKDHKNILASIQCLLNGESLKNIEHTLVTKDGQEFLGEISSSIIRDSAGKPVAILSMAQDITERRKMEDALRQERDMLEAVTRSVGVGLVVISKDYHVLWANGFIKRYKGDVEGKLCYATLNKLDAPCLDCGVKKIFEKGITFDVHEYTSTTVEGKPYWVDIMASPILNEKGEIIAATEIAVDITERKEMQKRLLDFAYRLNGLTAGSTYICESHEQAFKAYADLTFHGVPGLCLLREDPERITEIYGVKAKEVRLLASKPLKGFEPLADLQKIQLEVSQFLNDNYGGVVLLDGLEYLLNAFGFESVYRFIQEKRFDFLESGALLLIPVDMAALSEKEKALLTSELKMLKK